jgi:ribonuclease-3
MVKDLWLREVERQLGYRFRHRALLQAALTHPSTADEKSGEFERLEFLGDAILTLLLSLRLFRDHPTLPPGKLTRLRASLVSRQALAKAAKAMGLDLLMLLGVGGEATGGRRRASILAATFEAVVAAVYLDRGLIPTEKFLQRHLLPHLTADATPDPKSRLQAIVQAQWKTIPRYRLIHRQGPAHSPTFEVVVEVNRREVGKGQGGSRRLAEQEAAQAALDQLGRDH